ncbi:EscJ/YscJ/HrcJ family type III secretion inner membrane ring protein, partial [Achromobacter xylosoxidans]
MQAVPMPSSFAVDGRAHGGPLSRLRWLLLGLALLLAACGARVELFSAANESEANEVLSVLLDAGIAAQKATTKTGVAVSVDGQQVARALDILRSRGLPRERVGGLGQL